MKFKWVFVSIIGLIVIFFGVRWYRTPSAAATPDAIWVQTLAVKESTLPMEATAIGTLVARNVEITPELDGHVREILFQDGASVRKGDALFQLDDEVYKAKWDSIKAQLAYSQSDYHRKKLLSKQGVISQQEIDQAEADLKEKAANEKESAVMVSKMRLTAPFDGMLSKSNINLGDYVKTGQNLVTLTDTDHLRIEYTLPEKYLPLLRMGQVVNISTATYSGKRFNAKVTYISPTINSENRSVSLYAEVNNDKHLLAPGMFVNIVQDLGTEDHAMMIPARSLVPILDGEQVFKVVEGKAFAVTVTIGKRRQDNVQILDGLAIGDQIITDGQLKIRNGMPVQVKKEGEKSA